MRYGDLTPTKRRKRNYGRSGCCARIFFGLRKLFGIGAKRGVARQGFIERDAENHVAALVAAIKDHILPIFLVIVILLLAPRLAASEINSLRVFRPGKGMDFVRA